MAKAISEPKVSKKTTTKEKESVIQKRILDWLKLAGYFARKLPLSGMMIRSKGKSFMAPNPMRFFPDIILLSKHNTGKLLLIEVKSATGKLSPGQIDLHKTLISLGVAICVARSVEDVKLFLSEYDV